MGVWRLLQESWRSFRRHDGPLLSGAVAFYTLLATAPLGVFAVAIVGLVLGEDAARGELESQLALTLGPQGAEFVSEMIQRAGEPRASRVATAIGFIFFVVAATRLFSIIQAALNHVWGVRTSAALGLRGLTLKLLQKRLLAFAMVFVFGLTVLSAVLLKTGLLIVVDRLFGAAPAAWSILEFVAAVLVLTAMVAVLFRALPDVRIAWRDIWIGAAVTAAFTALGAVGISFYLGRASAGSMYGAAGSLVITLLWVYYTAQIFFLGAEFTGAWARQHGRGVRPLPHAVFVVEEDARTSILPARFPIEDENG